MTRLMTYIRELPVAKERVAPLVIGENGAHVVNMNTTIVVGSVLSVEDVEQSVKTVGYIVLLWRDEALAWNASHYSGIQSVEIPLDYIWTPPVGNPNSKTFTNLMDLDDMLLRVYCDGTVLSRAMFVTETHCDMDLTHYPFDRQKCWVLFMSYSRYTNWTINQDSKGISVVRNFGIGAEWEILETYSKIVEIPEYNESGIMAVIDMRRKTTFYVVCLVLPMALTSYMNTLVFLLPLESGEKISFLISIFVSNSVFVSYFTSVMPRSLDTVPISMKLLVGVMVESFVVLLLAIIVLQRHHRESKREPGKNLLCCSKDSRVHDISTGNKEREATPDEAELSPVAGRTRTTPTAEQLDYFFFVLSFAGNTIFLSMLLAQSVHG